MTGLGNLFKFKKNLSITGGLVLYILAVVSVTSILIMVSFYWFLSKHADSELRKKVKEYCYHLESSIERPLWLYDEETLIRTADNFFKSSPIASLKILDASEENILYENHLGKDVDMVTYHGNIMHKGELIGSIKIGLSTKEFRKDINNILLSAILVIVLISCGLLAFIFTFIGRFIKNPLLTLLHGIKSISEGDYEYRFKEFGQVEFNKISSAFHEMEDEVNKREKSLKDINGRLIQEIDERKKIENALRESEEKFRRLAQTTSAGIMVYQDDKWVYANPSAQRMTGYSLDELRTMFFWEIVAPSYRDNVKEKGEKRQKNIQAESGYETVIISKNKDSKWVYIEGNTTEYSGRPAGIVSLIDITERKNAEKGIRQAREFVDSIINSMPSILVSVDSGLKVKQWNQKAEKRTGISSTEATGKFLEDVFSDLGSESDKITDAIHSRDIRKVEKREYIHKGEVFYEDIIIYPVVSGEKDIAVIRIDDVTDRARLDEAIIEAESVRQSSKAKSEFLANMSHEMRTPLNGVIGMTSLALDTDLTDEQREFLEIVKISGENLLCVINDILDFSIMDAGKLQLDAIDFNLRQLLDSISEEISKSAFEKELELIHFVDPELPEIVKGDPSRLKQILVNLAGNAVKFTKKGEIVIRAEAEKDEGEKLFIKFFVHDTGIGIPQGKIEALFRPFEQLDGSSTREYGGTGIGLALCRQLTDLMFGTIGAKSIEGKGSTFWITIPFEKIAGDKTLNESDFSDLTGKKILIVDDNDTNRLLLKNLLDFWGCVYEEAPNGFRALDILREESVGGRPFEGALLDMCMPGMDGVELGKRIVEDQMIKPVALVMMSSIVDRGDTASLEKAGFSAYLTKPVKRDQLRKCISMVIDRNSAGYKGNLLTEAIVDYSKVGTKKVLLAEDNVVNQRVLLRYLNNLGYEVDIASTGLEVVAKLENYPEMFDIVFMDCHIPEMNGYQTCGKIRNGDAENKEIPIIGIIANVYSRDRERCFEAGMSDYILKPVKPENLEEMIIKWTGRSGRIKKNKGTENVVNIHSIKR